MSFPMGVKLKVTGSVFIDTFSFTSSFPESMLLDDGFGQNNDDLALGYINSLLKKLGFCLTVANNYGKNFYKNSAFIEFTDEVRQESESDASTIGFVAFGGNNNTFHVYLTGFACDYLNANSLFPKVHALLESTKSKINRCDTAFDCLNGERTVDDVVDWWEAGEFKTKGNTPKLYNMQGCWLPEDQHSRTFYVGSRESTKYFRAYEKGHQLGDLNSMWVRFEIEFKAKNKAIIPLDIILNPSFYLRNSYDCLSWIPSISDGVGIAYAIKTKVDITLDQAKIHAKKQYGKLLNVMVELGFSSDHILSDLSRCGVPSRLVMPPLGVSLPDNNHIPF
jgi:phage replication initiation protein